MVAEQKSTRYGVEDYVDRMSAQLSAGTSNKVCKHCLAVHREELLGPSCAKTSTQPSVKRDTLMLGVPSQHGSQVDVVVGDVFGDMPNSYATCKGILQHIRAQAKIGKDRQWVSVGCDGQPFEICRKLIDRSMVCDKCGEQVDMDLIEQHQNERHDGCEPKFHKLFDWLLLRLGSGHVEMNICKVLFRLLWAPVLQAVAKLLGFTSDGAQMFIKNRGNFHVTWQIIRVILDSILKELAVYYVRQCLTNDDEVTAEGMLAWAATARNNNYVLIHKVLDLVLATSVMRAGIRRNNSEAMLAGRQKVAPIFFTPHLPAPNRPRHGPTRPSTSPAEEVHGRPYVVLSLGRTDSRRRRRLPP